MVTVLLSLGWMFGLHRDALGQTLNLGNSADYLNAIQTIQANPDKDYTLDFSNDITVLQQPLNIATDSTIKLTGHSRTLNGNGLFQPLIIDKGTVELNGLNIANTSLPITLNGGRLIDQTGSLSGDVINHGIVAFQSPTAATYDGQMSGTGGVQILGEGPVTFTGMNTYSGGTFVAGGSQLTGTTTSLQGNIFTMGTVEFKQNSSGTYAGSIDGIGQVVISGTGPVTFTGANHYTGGTIINAESTLIGTTTSLSGGFSNSGTLQFNQQAAGTFAGSINGAGHVEISGTGPITFSGKNSYTGGTEIGSGSRLIGTSASLQGSILNHGVLEFDQAGTGVVAGIISGDGKVLISGNGPVVLQGLNTYSGGTIVDQGSTLMGTAKSLQGSIENQGSVQFISGGNGTFGGDISGSGGVTITSSAAIQLTGNNSYTGGTTIEDGGILTGTTASLQGAISNSGLLGFNALASGFQLQPVSVIPQDPSAGTVFRIVPGFVLPTANIFDGVISGNGRVEIGGGGITGFAGMNSYTGGTTVKSGSALTGSTTSLQGNILNNGFVQFDNSGSPATSNYSGNLSGTGGVEISGNNPVYFTGTNTYSGGTYIDAGSVLVGSTNSVQGTIVNDGNVTFAQNLAGTYSGLMTGVGGVHISGTGPITFTGLNTYTGGTLVDAESTLSGTTRSLQGSIVNNGIVTFDQTTDGTFAGSLSGAGDVQINGVGPVTFSGTNHYTGQTVIGNSATLIVTGEIAGDINVESGGSLKGSGRVGKTQVLAGGTIGPGNFGSPLTVQGDFKQQTGSTYLVHLNSTESDKIVVEGNAKIENGAKLELDFGTQTLTVGRKYEILTATAGIDGHYTNVFPTPTDQHIVFSQAVQADSLQVVVGSNLTPWAASSNSRMVASVIDYTSSAATGGYATTITQLTSLSSPQLTGALNQLGGDLYPTLSTIERQTTTAQLQLVSNRLAGLTNRNPSGESLAHNWKRSNSIQLVSTHENDVASDSDSAWDPVTGVWTTWGQGYGLGGNIASNGNAGGANYRLGGTLFGVEKWLNQKVLVGLLGGYAGTSMNSNLNDSSAQINAFQAGVYELLREEGFYVSNIDAYGNNSYDVSRPLHFGEIWRTANGTSQSNQWFHYSELGFNVESDSFQIQPFMGLQYIYLNQQGFNESGADSLNLTTNSAVINSIRNNFGLRLFHQQMWRDVLMVPSLAGSYQHEWGDGTQVMSSSFAGAPSVPFATSGNSAGRDFGLFSSNCTAYFSDRFSIFAAIDMQVATRYVAVIGSGGLQYCW